MKKNRSIERFVSHRAHFWDLEFNYSSGNLPVPKGNIDKLMNFIEALSVESNKLSALKLESDCPKNGLFGLTINNEKFKFNKEYVLDLCNKTAIIYLLAAEKSTNSPVKEDIIFELKRIKHYSEDLYQALVETNYFTREFLHADGPISRLEDEHYIAAMGETLPHNPIGDTPENGWLKNLMALRDFIELIQGEMRLAMNPVKGPLFHKAVGNPDFFIIWNTHLILALLDIEMDTAKNGVVPKLAQLIRDYALGQLKATEPGWQDLHVRSIIEWRTLLKKTRYQMMALDSILEDSDLAEAEKDELISTIQLLSDREGWLLANPGRISSEHGIARGNFTLFSDPTIPFDLSKLWTDPLD